MASHKVVSRFGLMHMVATNLCEWLYVLVEETKHEIYHLSHRLTGFYLIFFRLTHNDKKNLHKFKISIKIYEKEFTFYV